MTRRSEPVEFRARTKAPTESGWYYGRALGSDADPVPLWVQPHPSRPYLCIVVTLGGVQTVEWFGRCRVIKPSTYREPDHAGSC